MIGGGAPHRPCRTRRVPCRHASGNGHAGAGPTLSPILPRAPPPRPANSMSPRRVASPCVGAPALSSSSRPLLAASLKRTASSATSRSAPFTFPSPASARSCLLASTVNKNILRSPSPAQGNKNIPSRLLLLWAPVPLPACFKAAKPLAAPGHIEERRPIRDREHSALCCSLLSSDPCHHSGQID